MNNLPTPMTEKDDPRIITEEKLAKDDSYRIQTILWERDNKLIFPFLHEVVKIAAPGLAPKLRDRYGPETVAGYVAACVTMKDNWALKEAIKKDLKDRFLDDDLRQEAIAILKQKGILGP